MATAMRTGSFSTSGTRRRHRTPVRQTPYWQSLGRPIQRRLTKRDRRRKDRTLRQVVRNYRRRHPTKPTKPPSKPKVRHYTLPTNAPLRLRLP